MDIDIQIYLFIYLLLGCATSNPSQCTTMRANQQVLKVRRRGLILAPYFHDGIKKQGPGLGLSHELARNRMKTRAQPIKENAR